MILLSAGFRSTDLRGMTDAVVDVELFEKSQEPMHGARGFQTYQHRLGQTGIKRPHFITLVLQFLLEQLTSLIIQHGNSLLSSVQVHAYNFHLGLLRSEQCLVRAPTFYSARCKADFVMPSDGTFPILSVSQAPPARFERIRNRLKKVKESLIVRMNVSCS
jgi:hypothetical protein